MAEGTVKVHLHHICRKLGIANRAALAIPAQTKTLDAAWLNVKSRVVCRRGFLTV